QRDFVQAALDEEESTRIEHDDGTTLILVDVPIVEVENATYIYRTIALGIVLLPEMILTVCTRDINVLSDFTQQTINGFATHKRTRFILQILGRNTSKFLTYLKMIDRASSRVETELHRSMRNKELIQMLKLEKSLVFFSTSLKGNEVVLERMLRMDSVQKFPDDTDLLEDVIIENKQAIEMCNIYRDILAGTMDAFASIISNNLNIVMKVLTSITLLMTIPTLIASIWGMNVPLPFENHPYGFPIVVGLMITTALGCFFLLWRRKMF
ncbi:MAG: magnesium transporter CorA family protein, partial [Clostridia bacterium]